MSINSRLEKLERVAAGDAEKNNFVMLAFGQGWNVKIPSQIAPQVFRNIDKIYGQDYGF